MRRVDDLTRMPQAPADGRDSLVREPGGCRHVSSGGACVDSASPSSVSRVRARRAGAGPRRGGEEGHGASRTALPHAAGPARHLARGRGRRARDVPDPGAEGAGRPPPRRHPVGRPGGPDAAPHRAGAAQGAEGVWEVTVPLAPGAWRYNFNVDGVSVIDPRNPSTSESNENTWSLVHVPGADFMDTKPVPHGAVAAVTYYSTALKRFRRMHVYTPPGYETSTQRTRSSTCCTVRSTATTPGGRSAGPGSSSTT